MVPLLDELRVAIVHDRSPPKLNTVAQSLGVSVRTLQRRLREEGTSFVRQVAIARVHHAQSLMLHPHLSLSQIAHDAGFSSPSRLSIAFRKVVGTTPSVWRSTLAAKRTVAGTERGANSCHLSDVHFVAAPYLASEQGERLAPKRKRVPQIAAQHGNPDAT